LSPSLSLSSFPFYRWESWELKKSGLPEVQIMSEEAGYGGAGL
jgi:hypothetical protein